MILESRKKYHAHNFYFSFLLKALLEVERDREYLFHFMPSRYHKTECWESNNKHYQTPTKPIVGLKTRHNIKPMLHSILVLWAYKKRCCSSSVQQVFAFPATVSSCFNAPAVMLCVNLEITNEAFTEKHEQSLLVHIEAGSDPLFHPHQARNAFDRKCF